MSGCVTFSWLANKLLEDGLPLDTIEYRLTCRLLLLWGLLHLSEKFADLVLFLLPHLEGLFLGHFPGAVESLELVVLVVVNHEWSLLDLSCRVNDHVASHIALRDAFAFVRSILDFGEKVLTRIHLKELIQLLLLKLVFWNALVLDDRNDI